jgi:hypothetical protein
VSSLVSVLTTGNGKAYFPVNSPFAGWRVTGVQAWISVTPSSSGPVTIQFTRAGVPILSTALTVDANETSSLTAAIPAVIDPAQATLAAGDQIRVDVSTAGTGTLGLSVELVLSAP